MTITLSTPVSELKGVGPRRSAALIRLGIKTVDDLLHHYPTAYYFAPPRTDGPLVDGQPATVSGVVSSLHTWRCNLTVGLDTGIGIVWYNGLHLRESIFQGSCLMISGVVRDRGFINPEWKVYKEWDQTRESDLNTVTYPETSGITSKNIGQLVRQIFEGLKNSNTTPSGDEFFFIYTLHKPVSRVMADVARTWLKKQELFYMQLGLAMRQARREQEPPNVQCIIPPQNIEHYFPFQFTKDQLLAIGEILGDLCTPRAMNLLLQGDVGCGKTAVAAYAAIITAFNGAQTVILCPTELLARQHYETVRGYFEKAGVTCWLVVGRTVKSTIGRTIPGEFPDILIGTTAVLNDVIKFRNLGLVIIDEQHKFGVEQRAALRRHGNPHCLMMTATPIPRTIAMTVFGDLDISTIKTMPPGRKEVRTVWIRSVCKPNAAHRTMTSELASGHQVYVVCPRIEALDDEMRAVEEVHREYQELFPNTRVNYLHGQMQPQHRQAVVEDFRTHNVDILVSTTVVEVGVDNPNATVMVIEGAEHFGLAQLHQLRGRVGRGEHQSYCFLLSDTESADARSRLRIMEQTNDGFEIAEHDLKMRGPGDLLSIRQHGLPDLKLADLVVDYDLLIEARKEARKIVAKCPSLLAYPEMLAELMKRFGDKLLLGDTA